MNQPYNRVDEPRAWRRLAMYGGGLAAVGFGAYRGYDALNYYGHLGRALYKRGAAGRTIAGRIGETALQDIGSFGEGLASSYARGGLGALARRFFVR